MKTWIGCLMLFAACTSQEHASDTQMPGTGGASNLAGAGGGTLSSGTDSGGNASFPDGGLSGKDSGFGGAEEPSNAGASGAPESSGGDSGGQSGDAGNESVGGALGGAGGATGGMSGGPAGGAPSCGTICKPKGSTCEYCTSLKCTPCQRCPDGGMYGDKRCAGSGAVQGCGLDGKWVASGCSQPTPNCCGGVCTNTQTDFKNCGTCGNACVAPGCNVGMCF